MVSKFLSDDHMSVVLSSGIAEYVWTCQQWGLRGPQRSAVCPSEVASARRCPTTPVKVNQK